MKTKIALAIAVAFAAGLSGCSGLGGLEKNDGGEPVMRSSVDKAEVDAKEKARPAFAVRAGDKAEHVLSRLGSMNRYVYIVDGKTRPDFTVGSAPIHDESEMRSYVEAMGFDVAITGAEGSPYKRVSFKKKVTAADKGRKDCKTNLYGTMPLGIAVADVCREAGLVCSFADPAATMASASLYSLSYRGSCGSALDALAQSADLFLSYDDDKVEIKMMETVMLDLGIPMRDRNLAVDVVGANGSGSVAGAAAPATGATGGASGATSSTGQNGKSIKTTYRTNYLADINSLVNQTRSPQGSFSYMPETGQLMVRDKRENVKAITDAVSKLAAAYQTSYDIKMSFYRVTVKQNTGVSLDIARAFNGAAKIAVSGSSVLGSAAAVVTGTYDNGKNSKSTLEILSTLGTVETLDEYGLTAQSNIPNTVKVGQNIDYIKQISATPSGVSGTVTSSVESGTVTDGGFISVMARKSDADRISLELHAFLNRFDGFDVTQIQGGSVKSPQSFERTFDTGATLTEGVPYVVMSIKQNSRNDSVNTLPGIEKSVFAPFFGGRFNSSSQSYIVLVVEGNKQ